DAGYFSGARENAARQKPGNSIDRRLADCRTLFPHVCVSDPRQTIRRRRQTWIPQSDRGIRLEAPGSRRPLRAIPQDAVAVTKERSWLNNLLQKLLLS